MTTIDFMGSSNSNDHNDNQTQIETNSLRTQNKSEVKNSSFLTHLTNFDQFYWSGKLQLYNFIIYNIVKRK